MRKGVAPRILLPSHVTAVSMATKVDRPISTLTLKDISLVMRSPDAAPNSQGRLEAEPVRDTECCRCGHVAHAISSGTPKTREGERRPTHGFAYPGIVLQKKISGRYWQPRRSGKCLGAEHVCARRTLPAPERSLVREPLGRQTVNRGLENAPQRAATS